MSGRRRNFAKFDKFAPGGIRAAGPSYHDEWKTGMRIDALRPLRSIAPIVRLAVSKHPGIGREELNHFNGCVFAHVAGCGGGLCHRYAVPRIGHLIA